MRMAVVATLLAILVALAWATPVEGSSPVKWMLELTVGGRKVEGMPLAWNSQQVHLLGRDGRLWEFDPQDPSDYRKTSSRFRSYSPSELRAGLLRELGRDFEVRGTGHYMVAHPRGQRDRWPQRFEDLYRSFVHYFAVRGFKLNEPPFPLIGIVCKDRQDFYRFAASQGSPAGGGILGYYELASNRIILYDMTSNKADSANWQQNAATIIHEATHQTAFNTGIHSRYTPPPFWVAEGLATLFEAPGVYDSRFNTRRSDRINRQRFEHFRKLVAPKHRPELIAELIASDRLFRASPTAAYAEAWALTFCLMETQPRKYADYLARTARRPPFKPYTARQRTSDFTAVFGDDWPMLEARFLRFMAEIK